MHSRIVSTRLRVSTSSFRKATAKAVSARMRKSARTPAFWRIAHIATDSPTRFANARPESTACTASAFLP